MKLFLIMVIGMGFALLFYMLDTVWNDISDVDIMTARFTPEELFDFLERNNNAVSWMLSRMDRNDLTYYLAWLEDNYPDEKEI